MTTPRRHPLFHPSKGADTAIPTLKDQSLHVSGDDSPELAPVLRAEVGAFTAWCNPSILP